MADFSKDGNLIVLNDLHQTFYSLNLYNNHVSWTFLQQNKIYYLNW